MLNIERAIDQYKIECKKNGLTPKTVGRMEIDPWTKEHTLYSQSGETVAILDPDGFVLTVVIQSGNAT